MLLIWYTIKSVYNTIEKFIGHTLLLRLGRFDRLNTTSKGDF